jgi:chemotaxis protein CheD
MNDAIIIGMAELKVAAAPLKIATLGLGSCIGICIYDRVIKVGGMVHIMLPDSEIAHDKVNEAKFANTAVPLLVSECEKLGAIHSRLEVKIAGGAQMFTGHTEDTAFSIGAKNIQAVELAFVKMGMAIQTRNVGGNAGRSITLDLETGDLHIRTLNQEPFII